MHLGNVSKRWPVWHNVPEALFLILQNSSCVLGVEVQVRMDKGKEGILQAKDALAASWTAFPHVPPQPLNSAAKSASGHSLPAGSPW